MADDVTTAATTQQETPTSDAAQSAANYISGGLAAAQLYIVRASGRAGRAAADSRSIEAARAVYAPFLARDRGRNASGSVALAAWQAALPWRGQYRDAARAAERAGDRLRVLHPDAMARYDALRAGLEPVQAMREVAPLIGREIANPKAREEFAPMLTKTQGRDASSEQALTAWQAALPLREHLPDADLAASRAEDRLRELHPEAMARFDALRSEHSPAEAARMAAQLVADPPAQGEAPQAQGQAAGQAAGALASPSAAGSASDANSPTKAGAAAGTDVLVAEQKKARYAAIVTAALPGEVAALVLADDAWERLAQALEQAEQAGADPADLLATVSGQRELGSAVSPALVLAHRVGRADPADHSVTHPATSTPAPAAARTDTSAAPPEPTSTAQTTPETAPETVPDTRTGPERGAAPGPGEAPSAADVATQSFATPLSQAPAPEAAPVTMNLGASAAEAVLTRATDARTGTTAQIPPPAASETPAAMGPRRTRFDVAAVAGNRDQQWQDAKALAGPTGKAAAGSAVAPPASSAAAVAGQSFAVPITQAPSPSTPQAGQASPSQPSAPPPQVQQQNPTRGR